MLSSAQNLGEVFTGCQEIGGRVKRPLPIKEEGVGQITIQPQSCYPH
jgi:hypothetical protein